MATCEFLVLQDITSDCDNPSVMGIEANGVMINRADIDFGASEFDATRKNVIKTIALKAGKRGYAIQVSGNQPFNNTQTVLNVGTNRNSFIKDVAFTIFDNSPDLSEKVIDGLANGEFVIVYENKFKNLNKTTNAGDNAFEIVGWHNGARAQTLENNKYSEDTEGGWSVMLQESNAPKSGMFLFNTSYATTKTAVETLTEAA